MYFNDIPNVCFYCNSKYIGQGNPFTNDVMNSGMTRGFPVVFHTVNINSHFHDGQNISISLMSLSAVSLLEYSMHIAIGSHVST